jgi:hypothetical protein
MPIAIREELGEPTGYESLSPTTSTGITTSLITPTSGRWANEPALAALITVETKPIRFRVHGVPSATEGHLVNPNQTITITGEFGVKGFKCIDTAAGASTVKVTVFH